MLLVVNAGSSSVKLALFEGERQMARAALDRIGVGGPANHAEALTEGLRRMGVSPAALTAAAHRVVHGGARLTRATRITQEVLEGIEACATLAPLHNPANLTGIRAIAGLAPGLPQYASFDTAFHASNPDVATRYALPPEATALGLRRYGFHGLSYAGLVAHLRAAAKDAMPKRLLALHLGNGASLCAIRDGRSIATTMGYSPLEGLTMGTRAGTIDGNAVLRLAEVFGISRAGRMLNSESGLLALGGSSDMRALRAGRTGDARFAIDHFCYWAVRHAGSMIAAMGGLDAVAFTGGIGENDPEARGAILRGLDFLGIDFDEGANREARTRLDKTGSPVAIWIVPAEEERQIAGEALSVMRAEGDL
jgi:acetate kinase